MGTDEGEEERPWLFVVRVFFQTLFGFLGIADIVLLVGRVACSGRVDASATLAYGRIVTQAAEGIADSIYHVKGLVLLRKPIVIVLAAEVELADQVDGVTRISDFVVPGAFRAIVGKGIVPVADFVNVLAGCEGGSGRNADRAGCISSRKARSASGQGI